VNQAMNGRALLLQLAVGVASAALAALLVAEILERRQAAGSLSQAIVPGHGTV
jgi:heme exporter protein D